MSALSDWTVLSSVCDFCACVRLAPTAVHFWQSRVRTLGRWRADISAARGEMKQPEKNSLLGWAESCDTFKLLFSLRQTWQPLVEAFLHCKLAIIPQTQRDDGTACCAHRWVSKQNPRLSFLSHEIIRLRKSAVTAPRQQREPCCSRWNGCFLSKVTENKVKQKLYLWHPVL